MQNNTGLAIDHIGSAKSGCIYSSRWGKSIKANSDNDYCSIFGKMPGWSAEEVPRGMVQGQVGMVFVTIQMLTAVINNT